MRVSLSGIIIQVIIRSMKRHAVSSGSYQYHGVRVGASTLIVFPVSYRQC